MIVLGRPHFWIGPVRNSDGAPIQADELPTGVVLVNSRQTNLVVLVRYDERAGEYTWEFTSEGDALRQDGHDPMGQYHLRMKANIDSQTIHRTVSLGYPTPIQGNAATIEVNTSLSSGIDLGGADVAQQTIARGNTPNSYHVRLGDLEPAACSCRQRLQNLAGDVVVVDGGPIDREVTEVIDVNERRYFHAFLNPGDTEVPPGHYRWVIEIFSNAVQPHQRQTVAVDLVIEDI